MLDTQESIN